MIEFGLASFIFLTVAIDSLALTAKSVDSTRRFAGAYVLAHALTYITRLSLFFVLPIIGLILDGAIPIKLELFLTILAILFLFHSILFAFMYGSLRESFAPLIYLYAYNLPKFAFALMWSIWRRASMNFIGVERIKVIYAISHLILSLQFPVVLIIGLNYAEIRAGLMGSLSAYTGLFSIYFLFFVERQIPNLSIERRHSYIKKLIFSKCCSTLFAALVLLILASSNVMDWHAP